MQQATDAAEGKADSQTGSNDIGEGEKLQAMPPHKNQKGNSRTN
jgi:hypothetical protein